MPSATHGTINIIANRLMAVSERSLIGKSGVYTENNNESRIEGSSPCICALARAKILGMPWVLMCDGIGKRNCRRELVETDNIDDQIVHSCVVQIHATSILYIRLVRFFNWRYEHDFKLCKLWRTN